MPRFFTPILIFFLLFVHIGTVSAYSYAEAEDPMAKLFKTAVAAASAGSWEKVAGLAEKGIALQKNHDFTADHLASRFKKTIAEKEVSGTAGNFANLVYLSIREKLYGIRKEKFQNFKNSKSRLQLAYKSYLDVLDGNVKKNSPSQSSTIVKQFKVALAALGNPGLFGIGKKAPDPQAYSKAVEIIEKLVLKSFPGFANHL